MSKKQLAATSGRASETSLSENVEDLGSDLKQIFQPSFDPDGVIYMVLYVVGALYFLPVVGALQGFRYAYGKLKRTKPIKPFLSGQPLAVYFTMLVGAALFALLPYVIKRLYMVFFGEIQATMNLGIAVGNLVLAVVFIMYFRWWQNKRINELEELKRYGTADFATAKDLKPYKFDGDKALKSGFGGMRIGPHHVYYSSGHILTVAGTRGGKGVNLLVPALLKICSFFGSWVIVDPKGELAAITARIQRAMGRKVIMLNPWNLHGLGNTAFNPLDLLKHDRLNLADDVKLIAETIVPTSADGDGNNHFDNRARSLISGLLLHLVTAPDIEKERRHLGTLWQWLRLAPEHWDLLISEMSKSVDPIAGDIIQAAANEVISLMAKGEREFASVVSSAQKWTDFLQSPALRDSLAASTDFKPSDLTDKNTTVYLIIPADRLKTHYQWLRLVVSVLMRSVIRAPKNDVCFMLDEFYALGYLSEIDAALGSYAGFGVHIWAVLQNLVQLEHQYGKNWENFISSCSVRHFFNIADNTTADYVSKMFGTYSVPQYDRSGNIIGTTARNLVNPDELRRQSGENIYTVIDDLKPAIFPKAPYYAMPDLEENTDYDPNPYMERQGMKPNNEDLQNRVQMAS